MAELYLLIEGDEYYPNGGDDIRGVHGEWERAIEAITIDLIEGGGWRYRYDWSEVWEVEEGCSPIMIARRTKDGLKQFEYIS